MLVRVCKGARAIFLVCGAWGIFLSSQLQEAVAVSFEEEVKKLGQKDCYFTALAEELEPKRDAMAKFLSEAGIKPTVPDGGYFMMADFSALGL